MKLTTVNICLLMALASVANYTLAENYQFEAAIGVSDGEADTGGSDVDIEGENVGLVLHFSEVDTSKGPLAESSFLDRASSVSIGYSTSEVGNVDTDILATSFRLVSKEYGATAEFFVLDGEVDNAVDADADSFGLSIGYYITENTELSVSHMEFEVDDSGDTDSSLLQIKHVSTGNTAFSIEAAIGIVEADTSNDTVYSLGGTIYLTSRLGIGANYSLVDSPEDIEQYGAYVEWFVNPAIAIALSYDETETDSDLSNSDAVSLNARFRF